MRHLNLDLELIFFHMFVVRNKLPIGSESDSVAPILIIVSMLVDDMKQTHRFLRSLMIVKGQP